MKTDKVTQLVVSLMKLTSKGEVNWKSNSPYNRNLPNDEVILDKIYTITLEQGRFRVYRYKYKIWIDDERFEWGQRIRMELIDNNGDSEYEFEYENSMNDLYDIIREKTSNVSSIVDNVLEQYLKTISVKKVND